MSDATKALIVGLAPISKRSHALAKLVHKGQLVQKERSIMQKLFLVFEQKGFEEAFDWLMNLSPVENCAGLIQKMRSMAHLFRRGEELELLECWLNKKDEDEFVLWQLYRRGRPFLRKIQRLSGSSIEKQIEMAGLLLYDVSEKHIVLGSSSKICLYDRMTGRCIRERAFHEAKSIQLCQDSIFVAGDFGLWSWSKEECVPLHRRPSILLCSFADRVAVLEKDNRVSILDEDFSFYISGSVTLMELSIRGLNLALGTEEGDCWIAEEGREKAQKYRLSSVAITALCWTEKGDIYVGDEEGGVFLIHKGKTSCVQRYESSVLSISLGSSGIRVALGEGRVIANEEHDFFPDAYAFRFGEGACYLGMFVDDRFCILSERGEKTADHVCVDNRFIHLFCDVHRVIDIFSGTCVEQRSLPHEPLIAVSPQYILDRKGNIWCKKQEQWQKTGVLPTSKIQHARFLGEHVWVQGASGYTEFDLDGALIQRYPDRLLISSCGNWHIEKDAIFWRDSHYIGLDVVPSCIVGDSALCFVSSGTILKGFDQDGVRLERDFEAPIVSLAWSQKILVIALRGGWIYALDCISFATLGKYATDNIIEEVQCAISGRILVRERGGSVSLLQIDGLQR